LEPRFSFLHICCGDDVARDEHDALLLHVSCVSRRGSTDKTDRTQT
jgi:hypothetical protein